MELHPDRFVGDDGGAAAALDRMLEVRCGGARGAAGSVGFAGTASGHTTSQRAQPRPQQPAAQRP
jgi:hypothetical protein